MGISRQLGRFVLLVCLGARMGANADSVSLTPTADTTISQKSSVQDKFLVAGTNGKSQSSRALLKFDIAGNIPSNAIITSTTLTMYVSNTPPSGITTTIDLRAVLLSWDEANATWTNRLLSTPWSIPSGAIGVDFSSTISQTNFFDATEGTYHTFVSSSNLVADVQNWLQNPGANFGWVMISESEGTPFVERTMTSRETLFPPVLLVTFIVPASKPTITRLPLTNGVFRFSFNAESNRAYSAQYTGNLSGTNWSVLTNFSAAPKPTNFVVSDPLTYSNRFYRVQTP